MFQWLQDNCISEEEYEIRVKIFCEKNCPIFKKSCNDMNSIYRRYIQARNFNNIGQIKRYAKMIRDLEPKEGWKCI